MVLLHLQLTSYATSLHTDKLIVNGKDFETVKINVVK